MKLLNAMATIAGFTMLSRIAGMVRDMLTASILGASAVADAFLIALKLPNFFRRVAAEGAFSVTFVPLYSKMINSEGEDEAAKFSGQVFSLMAIILGAFSIIVMISMPWVIHLIAPGFDAGGERYNLAVSMTQITFPYLLLISLTALFGGMLNSNHHFSPFAAAPIIFNLTVIIFLLCFVQFFPTAGHAMAFGVSLSGLLQLLMMVFFVRRYKIKFHFMKPQFNEKTKKLFKLMLPATLSAGVFQVNLLIDMMIASTLASGSISYLYYADRLNQLPLGIAGIAVGTALLPMLSTALSTKNHIEANNLFNRSIEFCLFVGLPAAVALLMIPYPMVATLFGHGNFTVIDAQITAYVLMGAGVGLPAYIVSKVFLTAFWSHEDTITPVKIAVITAVANIILCLILIKPLGVAGISLATSLAGWLQVYLLNKKLKQLDNLTFDTRLRNSIPKITICACIMAVVMAIMVYILGHLFHNTIITKTLALAFLIIVATFSYLLAIHLSGVLKINQIRSYFQKKKSIQ